MISGISRSPPQRKAKSRKEAQRATAAASDSISLNYNGQEARMNPIHTTALGAMLLTTAMPHAFAYDYQTPVWEGSKELPREMQRVLERHFPECMEHGRHVRWKHQDAQRKKLEGLTERQTAVTLGMTDFEAWTARFIPATVSDEKTEEEAYKICIRVLVNHLKR